MHFHDRKSLDDAVMQLGLAAAAPGRAISVKRAARAKRTLPLTVYKPAATRANVGTAPGTGVEEKTTCVLGRARHGTDTDRGSVAAHG